MSLFWALGAGLLMCLLALGITTHGEERFSLPLSTWLVLILVNLLLLLPWGHWVALPLDALYLGLGLAWQLLSRNRET